MAPVSRASNTNTPKFGIQRRNKGKAQGTSTRAITKKRKWKLDASKNFLGSVKEGKGFAVWRKQKILHDYKKLLRKERKACPRQDVQYMEKYPEHLKHLYLAEEEMLKKLSKKKLNRKPFPENEPSTQEKEKSTIKQKTSKKKTSNQKAKEEYERIQTERAQKRKDAEIHRQQREEAIRQYKQKKAESYKILSKKTKKGQPNLNVQMEYLLQKIQEKQRLEKK